MRLMAVGMTTVFAFLTLLVVAMQTILRPIGGLFPDSAAPSPTEPEPVSQDAEIAVVLAAVAAARGGH